MTLAAMVIIGTDAMGLVKTRRLAAMQKQQRAKFGTPQPVKFAARKNDGYFLTRNGGKTKGKDSK